MMNDGLLEQILATCKTIETVQQGLPNEDRVRVIIREEQQRCPAFRGYDKIVVRTAQNTGTIKTMLAKGARISMAPARAARRLPVWAQILIGVLSTSGVGALIAAVI